jgi:hypothetical protein
MRGGRVYSAPMRPVPTAAAHRREDGVILELIAGLIALATALGFLGVLVYKVWSIPLWIVILLGAAMMVASLIESMRSDQQR